MIKSYSELSNKEREELRDKLCKIYEKKCHYCGIEEKDFQIVWGDKFYGSGKRGRRLEIEHKDPSKQGYDLENLVFACALCNMAKSNMFYYDEFKKIGAVIREIWQERRKSGRSPCQGSLTRKQDEY